MLLQALEDHPRVGSLLGSALARDRRLVERLLAEWERGEPPTPATYRALLLASLRVQAALWHPSGWWFALW